MKKIISIFLSVIMITLFLPIKASAKAKYNSEPYIYPLHNLLYSDTGLGISVSGLGGDNIQNSGYDGYYVSVYDKNIKKYRKLFTMNTVLSGGYYYLSELTPNTEYKFAIRFFKNINGKQKTIKSYYSKARTKDITPHTLQTLEGKKLKFKWTILDEWDGFEFITTLYQKEYFENYDPKYVTSKTYILENGKKRNYTINIGKKYDTGLAHMRAYRIENGKKVYSATSLDDYYSVYFNSKFKNPEIKLTASKSDNKIIKKALKACVTEDMTAYQMGYSLLQYVRMYGRYEYDYSKIDNNPLKAVFVKGKAQCYQWAEAYRILLESVGIDAFKTVGGKKGNSNHWWVEADLDDVAGELFLIDPYPVTSMYSVGNHYITVYSEAKYAYGSNYIRTT